VVKAQIFSSLFVSGEFSFPPLLHLKNAESGHILQLFEAVAVEQKAATKTAVQGETAEYIAGMQEAATHLRNS
jgi:hypothetical protein